MTKSIAQIDPREFYQDAFSSRQEASEFLDDVLQEQNKEKNRSVRQILYQAQRMLWLADRLQPLTKSRQAFQILFYLIAAELCAKIVKKYDGESKSREHAHIFFEEICTDKHRRQLQNGFSGQDENGMNLSLDVPTVVNILYDIRCDVVHRGEYDFYLPPDGNQDVIIMNSSKQGYVSVSIKPHQLRQIVLEGVVAGARKATQI